MNNIKVKSTIKTPFRTLEVGELGSYDNGYNHGLVIRTDGGESLYSAKKSHVYGVNLSTGHFVFDGEMMVTRFSPNPTITVE